MDWRLVSTKDKEAISVRSDVLFINPGNHRKNYQDLSKEYSAVATPVWTLLLADHTRRGGYSTAIYDVNVEGWDEETAREVLSAYNPELVVMMVYGHNPSASTQTMPAAGRIAGDIKRANPDVPIAFGGTHPSALPERTLSEEAADFVIQGEGHHTVDGLIESLKGKRDIKDVPGLWRRKGGGAEFTAPAPLATDLDNELGWYAWDMLPGLEKYRAHNMHCFQDFEKSKTSDFTDVRTPYVSMNTSLGCPFSCHYCCINAVFDKPGIRYWSLERVAEWMDILHNTHGVRNIRFDDELFILNPKRVERFCDMMIERDYDLNFWVYGRVDTVREGLLKKLKRAGVNWICLGIESGSEKVRNDVNKRISNDIREVVRKIQDHGIYVHGNYVFGLPEDDLETMQETLDLAIDLNCEIANFYSVMAYPGSKLYEWAESEGKLPEGGWECFSQLGYNTWPLPTKHISPAEVLNFRDEAFTRYHTNPRYLEMIRAKFGPRVEKHLTKMLEVKIRRRLLEKTNIQGG